MAFRRILVGVDFSIGSRYALGRAKKIALESDAELVLLHVVTPIALIAPPGPHRLTHAAAAATAAAASAAEKKLRKHASQICRSQVRVRSLVEIGSAAEKIVETAKRLHADVVVVGTAGRTGLAHLLVGSVAERVVRTSAVPVLTVHAPPRRAKTPVSHEPRTVTLI